MAEPHHLASLPDELERQVLALEGLGYPALAGRTPEQLRSLLEPVCAAVLDRLGADVEPASPGHVPVVLVITREVVATEQAMSLTHLDGRTEPGVVDRNHGEGDLAGYQPVEPVVLPSLECYALLDVQRGEEFCGVAPQDALAVVLSRGRTPLTIDEGVAVVTLFPQVLQKNRCFMLSGSRRGDRRVPALWISGRAPKLGWCWDGNPHSWLGTASAGDRVA